MLEWFLALRYLRPQRNFVSLITFLSMLGVTLAVLVLIVVLSVMAGFERELRDKVIGFNAHLIVTNTGVLSDVSTRLRELEKEPEVRGAAPFVSGPVMVTFAHRITTPILRGIDPVAEEKVLPLRKYLVAGEFELRGESILVGQEWAQRNGAFVGDKILVYAPRQLESLRTAVEAKKGQVVVLPTELLITGVFRTGLYDYDLNFLLTSLETAQYLYNLGHGVHGIAVMVRDPDRVAALQQRLNARFTFPLQARTWMDQNRPLFTAIATERVAMTFILFFIMIVAGFGLSGTLITISVQKSHEIGLLKALGATDGQVLGIFLRHGLLVGFGGSLLGVGTAVVVLAWRNDFRHWLAQQFGVDVFAADIYNFAQIPAEISWPQVTLIGLSGVMVCMLAALWPAWKAARLSPARALRRE